DEVLVSVGDVVERGRLLLRFTPSGDATDIKAAAAPVDLDAVRQDLRELRARLEMTLDAQRPVAVARRHARGLRTARENVYDLCDSDSFQEYGQLIVAAQRRVKTLDELQHTTPADGLVAGFGTVNAELFGPLKTRCAVLAYDYTVLAGTQGLFNHKKTDRVLSVAHRQALPVIFFCEGGGGRPSDTDFQDIVASTLDVHTFATYAASSGQAPRIGIASGPCFAGNAVLFGSSDITIATRSANIGMAGPAMVTAGGLGACRTQDIGPIDVQAVNGVVDLVAADEAEAVELARRALSFFQGVASNWTVTDQRMLRHAVPEDRKRAYDVRPIIDVIFDENSFLELRRDYGPGMITGFARLEGRPVGLYANDPRHLGGAIDADGAQKAARFMLLCDAFGLPLVSLCDTPGFMVGPAHEREASVRRSSRMLVVAASLSVPTVMVCLRKGYGLGAQAMAGGSFCSPMLNVAWPTGEFGPMGLEGAVQLGFRKQLAAAPNAAAQKALFEREVGRLYEVGKALSTASMMEIDAVIDPADTRPTLVRALASFVPQPRRSRFVDVW
ncbi:MAG: carboxyl transferase domain-containing protein, partial [Myxococcota bacterium]